jgi:mannose-1-phosphate guanylyltransferase
VEAIVLVGGHGTRLRPLTLTTPKPMLPVAGVPFLTHQLARLAAVGVDHVVLATSYRAEAFREHFGDEHVGVRITYVHETEALGTGGGIRNAASALTASGPVIVLNGDVLSGHDMGAQLHLHAETSAVATLHLVTVEDARRYGCVPTNPIGRVLAFHEKMDDPVSNQINAGCYVLERSMLDEIPSGRVVSIEREIFPPLVDRGETVMGYVDDSYWIDVGTPADYVRAGSDLVSGAARSPAFAELPSPAWIAAGADVDASATVVGGSAVGPGCVVEADAYVDGSVLMAGCRVARGASVTRSVVGVDAVVGAGCSISDSVVGDTANIGERNELQAGARVWPHVALPDVSIRFSTDA